MGDPVPLTAGEAPTYALSNKTAENLTPQMVTEKQKETESTYSKLITNMITDSKEKGRYFAIFGYETPAQDQRILLFTHSTAAVLGEELFTVLTREGPRALKVQKAQAEKLKLVRNNQIKAVNEDRKTFEKASGGGGYDSVDAMLLFNDTRDPSLSVSTNNTLILEQKDFLDTVTKSRNAAESPYKRKLEKETARLTEAQQTLDAFNALIRTPNGQTSAA